MDKRGSLHSSVDVEQQSKVNVKEITKQLQDRKPTSPYIPGVSLYSSRFMKHNTLPQYIWLDNIDISTQVIP